MSDSITKDLRNILDSNIPKNKEEKVMAKFEKARAKKEEEQKTKDQQDTKVEGEVNLKSEDVKPKDVKSEDVKPKDVKSEDVKPEEAKSESTEDTANRMRDLLSRAKAEQREQGSSVAEKTQVFNTETTTGGITSKALDSEMTPEEKAAHQQAEEEKQRRKLKIQEYNRDMKQRDAEIKEQLKGETKFTPIQQEYQAACASSFLCEAIVMEQSEVPNLNITRSWMTQDGQRVYHENVTQAQKDALLVPKQKVVVRGNVQKFTTSLKYNYSRPKNFIGAIVSLPSALNISFQKFTQSQIEIPTVNELIASPRIVFPVDFDTFFIYTMLYCDGEMKEPNYMKDAKFLGSNLPGKIRADIVKTTRTVDGIKTPINSRKVSATNRSSVWVKENIIPIKLYMTEDMNKMSADTQNAYKEMFVKKLGASKDEKYTWYDALDATSKELFDAELSDGNVTRLSVGFLEGTAQLGIGKYGDYALRHWSRSMRNAEGKVSYEIVPNNPVAKYQAVVRKDGQPNKITYKKVYKMLGESVTLNDLANYGYIGAKHVAELNVKEADILSLYQKFLDNKRKERERKLAAQGKLTNRRVSNVLDRDLAAKVLQAEISGSASFDLGLNTDDVLDTLMSNTYESAMQVQ